MGEVKGKMRTLLAYLWLLICSMSLATSQEMTIRQEPEDMALQVGAQFQFSCSAHYPRQAFSSSLYIYRENPAGTTAQITTMAGVYQVTGSGFEDVLNITATQNDGNITLNVRTERGVTNSDDKTRWGCLFNFDATTLNQTVAVTVISLSTLTPYGCWNRPTTLVTMTNDTVAPLTPLNSQAFFERCSNLTREANYSVFAVARDALLGLACLSGPDAATQYRSVGRSTGAGGCDLTTRCFADGLGGEVDVMSVYALQKEAANSVCQIFGGIHYLTFDGEQTAFSGSCSYVAVRYEADAELAGRIVAPKKEVFSVAVDQGSEGRVKGVTVTTEYWTVKMEGTQVTVNGQIHFPPFFLTNQAVNVRVDLKLNAFAVHISEDQAGADEADYVSVIYDRMESVQITARTLLQSKLEGLCGNYDGDWRNDFWQSNSSIPLSLDELSRSEASVAVAQSWTTNDCSATTSALEPLQTCDSACLSEVYSPSLCGFDLYIPENPFYACLAAVSSHESVRSCERDTCTVKNSTLVKDAACGVLSSYARACEAEGYSVIGWREYYNCSLTCGVDAEYKSTTSACPSSCRVVGGTCNSIPAVSSGCVCNDGYELSGTDCIPVTECGCSGPTSTFNFLIPVGVTMHTADCTKKYTCSSPGNKLKESDGIDTTCDRNAECIPIDGFQRCVCIANFSGNGESCFFSCPAGSQPTSSGDSCELCPKDSYQPDPDQSSCIACPLRAITNEVGSVNGSQCYRPDESTEGSCTLFGDSHYVTFDGARIDFAGSCRYTALETVEGILPRIQILVQQSVSKPFVQSVYANLNGTLVQIGPLEADYINAPLVYINGLRTFPPYNTSDISISIGPLGVEVITSGDLGVKFKVSFDWLLRITVPRALRGDIKGICGNYDRDPKNDYISKQGIDFGSEMLADASMTVGNSFKTFVGSTYCPDSLVYSIPKCQGSMKTDVLTKAYCGFSLEASTPESSNPLAECLSTDIVNIALYESACQADVCRDHLNVTGPDVAGCVNRSECAVDTVKAKAAACLVLGALVDQCRTEGFSVVGWREAYSCGAVATCPEDSIYTTETSTCPSACPNPSDVTCSNVTEGCSCEGDFVWSGYKCVAEFNCGCQEANSDYYWPLLEGFLSPGCSVYKECRQKDFDAIFEESERGCAANASCVSLNGNRDCVCDEGYFGNGNTKCTACNSGQRQTFDGLGCESCPSGTYQPQEAQTSCDICPTRGATNATGAVSSEQCLPPDSGTCVIYGDPHYYTFDGKRIDFQGLCTYTAVEYCAGDSEKTYRVDIKQEKRGGIKAVLFGTRVTYIEYVVFSVENNVTVRLLQGGGVEINGARGVTLPAVRTTASGTIVTVSRVPNGVEAVTSEGVRVWYEGDWHATITVPGSHYGKVCGIGGNFDGNLTNDLVTRNGTYVGDLSQAEASAVIGNSWTIAQESAVDGCANAPATIPFACQGDMAQRVKTIEFCGFDEPTGGNPFLSCLSRGTVNFDLLALTCEYDVCENHLDVTVAQFREFPVSCLFTGQCHIDPVKAKTAACGVIQTVARDCEFAGASPIGWRTFFGCPLPSCSNGSVYSESASSCPKTCASLGSPATNCSLPETEGCACPIGKGGVQQAWSDSMCVDEDQCGCTDSMGSYWPPNTESLNVDCTVKTQCSSGSLTTALFNCPSDTTCGGYECVCREGFKQGGDSCSSCPAGTFAAGKGSVDCVACPRGFTSETEASSCSPCPFGFTTSGEGTSALEGCVPLKAAVCSISGDPHIYTFDGGRRDYQGICSYYLAKNCIPTGNLSTVDFDVIGKFHRVASSTRVSYVEYIDVRVDRLTVRLLNGGGFLVDGISTFAPYSNRTDGMSSTTVDVQQTANGQRLDTGFGLSVWYDGRTEARITIPNTFFNKSDGLCGLCGSYDSDTSNDLTAEGFVHIDSFGVPIAVDTLPAEQRDALIGDSWKVPDQSGSSLICPAAVPVRPMQCQKPMDTQVYDYCGGQSTSVYDPFYACASSGRVTLSNYWESCRYDVCENHLNVTSEEFENNPNCLSTGQCFIDYDKARAAACDSLTAAALYCSLHGFPAAGWRSVYSCPLQCPRNSYFLSETSACPPTCASLDRKCPDSSLVEGCVCDEDYVWSGGLCVPKTECGCTVDGRYYPRGSEWSEPDCSAINTCWAGEVNSTAQACQSGAECRNAACVCSKGTIPTMANNMTECIPCPAGKYLDMSAGACEVCPSGTFSGSAGAVKCEPCPHGTLTESSGSDSKNDCKKTPIETCRIFGDPHYRTYDGVQIDFQGTCRYTASKTCGSVEKGDVFDIVVKQQRLRQGSRVTYIDYLDFYDSAGVKWSLLQDGDVMVDDTRTFLPYTQGNVTVVDAPQGVILTTTSGVVLTFNGQYMATITVPRPTYGGKLCGLCADCDGYADNDRVTADNVSVASRSKAEGDAMIGGSWTVEGDKSEGVCPPPVPVEPFECQGVMAARVKERNYCGFSSPYSDSPLLSCLSSGRVNFDEAADTCEYDVCEDHLNITADEFNLIPNNDCLSSGECVIDFVGSKEKACGVLFTVAETCESLGFNVFGWRSYFQCPLPCKDNQQYTDFGSACPNSCSRPNATATCATQRPGCVCSPGYVLSGRDCVRQEDCGCVQKDKYYPKGHSWSSDDCLQSFVCNGGANITETNTSCPVNSECHRGVCECDSGHIQSSDGRCLACSAGSYLDERRGREVCSLCPIGTYSEESAQTRCQSCSSSMSTENEGSKNESDCTLTGNSVCTVYGDPHYYTFDGIRIDFQGECRYTASKSCTNDTKQYHVIIKQEKRGGRFAVFGNRVTFIQYVEIIVDDVTIRLLKEGKVEVEGIEQFTPIKLITSNENTTVEVDRTSKGVALKTNYGLNVWYDGNWHSTITVPRAMYAGKVCGLCADCDADDDNDLMTSAGELVEIGSGISAATAHTLVGNSWKVTGELGEGICEDVLPVEPLECQGEMASLVKTPQYCGFGSSFTENPFYDCISAGQVDFDLFEFTCEYDVCENHLNISAEDFPDMKDCLSTGACYIDFITSKTVACGILAVVAQECEDKRQPVPRWRSYFQCPAPCYGGSQFQYSTSACANTCSKKDASSTCPVSEPVEGCVCPPGEVWSGPNCVAVSECGCNQAGRYYPANAEWTTTDCLTEYKCVNGTAVSKSLPGCGSGQRCSRARCECLPGYLSALANSTSCEPCAAGSYLHHRGECVSCPTGSYSSQSGASKCEPCERGFTTTGPGANSKDQCESNAEGVCTIWGDPHYVTFDGQKIDFQGECRYTAATTVGCPGANQTRGNFTLILKQHKMKSSARVTFIEYVDFFMDDVQVRLLDVNTIEVNGAPEFTPFNIKTSSNATVKVERRPDGLHVVTDAGVSLYYDGNWRSTITVHNTYGGNICGMCGNYDGIKGNDRYTKEGVDAWEASGRKKSKTDALIGNSWKLNPTTDELAFGVCPDAPPVEPLQCQGDLAVRVNTREYCGFDEPITDNPFSQCISFNPDFSDLAESCEFDVCEAHLDPDVFFSDPTCLSTNRCSIDYEAAKSAACATIATVAASCASQGWPAIGWRTFFNCPLKCPATFEFNEFSSACPATCRDRNPDCSNATTSGCECPDGKILSGSKCVDVGDCGCIQSDGRGHDRYYPSGSEWLSADCGEAYRCNSSDLTTTSFSCPPSSSCKNRQCKCDKGSEILPNSTCVPCPAGSRLRGNTCTMCPKGTYSDVMSSTRCKACPKQLTTLATGSSNATDCVDKSEAVCTIYGDPHYYTFDGERIDFQGECRYTAVKSCTNDTTGDFHVIVKQEKRPKVWGNRVTFIEYVDLNVDNVTVRLLRGGKIEIDGSEAYAPTQLSTHSGVTVKVKGQPDGILITTSSDIQVWYDGNVHATVTLLNTYKGKVCGLCGNYNGADSDDVTTLDGENALLSYKKAEAHAVVGNSFKLAGDLALGVCPDAPPVEALDCQGDLADGVKDVEYCGFGLSVLGNPLLDCVLSGRVDFALFALTCEYDVCEGHLNVTGAEFALMPDCLSTGACFIDYAVAKDVACRAVAVVAQQCSDNGFTPIAWRSYFNCPLECDGGSVFKEQVSTCRNTCQDRNASATCGNAQLVPGCVCPPDMVWSGDDCVKESNCGCTVDGEYRLNNKTWLSENCNREHSCINGVADSKSFSCADGETCDDRECECRSGHARNSTADDAGCYPCPAGWYLGDKDQCEACPQGTYQDQEGMERCKVCSADKTTTGTGSMASSDCLSSSLAVCYVFGDPHYLTFDEAQIDYKGECRYTAAKSCADLEPIPYFHIIVQQEKRRKGHRHRHRGRGARVKYVDVLLGNKTDPNVFTFYKKDKIIVDGVKYNTPVKFELTATGETVDVRRVPGGILLTTNFNLRIHYDGKHGATIEVPRLTFGGKTCGLCGDCDGVLENDYVTAENVSVAGLPRDERSAQIGNSWQVPEELDYGVCPPSPTVEPNSCLGDMAFRVETPEYCGMTSLDPKNPLLPCLLSGRVDVNKYTRACVSDVCENYLNITIPQFLSSPDCLTTGQCSIDYEEAKSLACEAVEKIAEKCEKKHFDVSGWREFFTCPADCEGGSVYNSSTSSCPRACGDPVSSSVCPLVAGCACPHGQVWSGDVCVLESDCGCKQGRYYYKAGENWLTNRCTTAHSCPAGGGDILSGAYSCADTQVCKGEECVCKANHVWNSAAAVCEPCPAGSYYSRRADICELCPTGTYTDSAGNYKCKTCKRGYVTDMPGATSKSMCVKLTYTTCKVFGDPHYLTFDGQRIDFQGACRYTAAGTKCPSSSLLPATTSTPATSSDSKDVDWSVVIQHEARFGQKKRRGKGIFKNKSVTYTKDVDVYIGAETWIRLGYNNDVLINQVEASTPFSLRTPENVTLIARRYKGGIRLDARSLGLYVHFNGYNAASIRVLTKTYGGKICGICGNADGDLSNDLMTSTGVDVSGYAEKPEAFTAVGNSWIAPVEYSLGVCESSYAFNPLPCPAPLADLAKSLQFCGFGQSYLNNPLYSCIEQEAIDFDDMRDTCLYDVCETGLNVSSEQYAADPSCLSTGACVVDTEGAKEQACGAIAVAVSECQSLGYAVSAWRTYFDCPLACSGGQTFTEYAAPCQRTCADVRGSSLLSTLSLLISSTDVGSTDTTGECAGSREPGCECPFGQVWSGGLCVDEDNCGCLQQSSFGEIYRKIGESWLSFDCSVRTTCQASGKLDDMPHNCSTTGTDCMASVCVCPVGSTYKNDTCSPCLPGTFYTIPGEAGSPPVCQTCPPGTYQEMGGQTRCVSCGSALTTAGVGADNRSSCIDPFGGHAMVFGDPHYITFDGSLLTAQGECSYVVAQSCGNITADESFRVEVTQGKRSRGHGSNASDEDTTFVKRVTVTIGDRLEVTLFEGGRVWVNGEEVWAPTFYMRMGSFQFQLSPDPFRGGVVLNATATPLLDTVFYDGRSLVYVTVPQSARGAVCGIAGTYDRDMDNDYTTQNGTVLNGTRLEMSTLVADSWVGESSDGRTCSPMTPVVPRTNCTGELASRLFSRDVCGFDLPSLSNPFFFCLASGVVSPKPFLETCAFDVCEYQFNTTDSKACGENDTCTTDYSAVKYHACSSINAMAERCGHYGMYPAGWRSYFRCDSHCPKGAVYSEKASTSISFCHGGPISNNTDPSQVSTFEGCECPSGMKWDLGVCVAEDDCSCQGPASVDGRVALFTSIPRNVTALYLSCSVSLTCGSNGMLFQPTPTGGCVDGAECTTNGGRAFCICSDGYNRTEFNPEFPGTRVDPPGSLNCTDIDECKNDTVCHANAICTNIPGSWNCSCASGYEGDGFLNCTNIDECVTESPCDSNATCVDTLGSYNCSCNTGYLGNGTVCTDLNECTENNRTSADGSQTCHEFADCTNSIGSFACDCLSGFMGDGFNCKNINECANTTSPICHINADCTDTSGSYNCTCMSGYMFESDNYTCSDIDECGCGAGVMECPAAVCHKDALCANTAGSYNCTCMDGYEGNGTSCMDIDECSLGSDNCVADATCSNLNGSFSCDCKIGFSGVGNSSCIDNDECMLTTDNCHGNATCNNTHGSFDCTCNEGYQGNGTWCDDVDECAMDVTPCDNILNQVCNNTIGSYACTCEIGFERNSSGHCVDIDECTTLVPCHENATCTNFPGSYECKCNSGFFGIDGTNCSNTDKCLDLPCDREVGTCKDGAAADDFTCFCPSGFNLETDNNCTDIDECMNTTICQANADCMNLPGTYECPCSGGFLLNATTNTTCDDINECDILGSCADNATCANTLGNYTCTCNAGYEGDGRNCTDVNECSAKPCSENGVCTNMPGTYACVCDTGYNGNGTFCADIDECVEKTDNCTANSNCTNFPGNFTCPCESGFSPNGSIPCDNVNECAASVLPCAVTTAGIEISCVDTIGSFYCTCPDGFNGSGLVGEGCVNIDECSQGLDNCHSNASCQDNSGSFVCACKTPAFVGNGTYCKPFDVCEDENPCDSLAVCYSKPSDGSLSNCTCPSGYGGNGLVGNCTDVDECLTECTDVSEICNNTVGSYTCECSKGYFQNATLPEFQCADVNECANETLHSCINPSYCTNSLGNYLCECPLGYSLNTTTNTSCDDIDECMQNTTYCGPNSVCTNSIGSVKCTCELGFSDNATVDGFLCNDVDECGAPELNNCSSNSMCTNTVPGFTCTCLPGYNWDGSNCTDVNECSLAVAPCGDYANCTNNVGSFSCECWAGFNQTNATTCVDIDECRSELLNPCEVGSDCVNGPGNFSCVCWPGYEKNATGSCVDIDECTTDPSVCHSNATCTNSDGSYTCACKDGFLGNGSVCADVKNCDDSTLNNCSSNARCVEEIGSFSCACLTGYDGDGVTCNDIDECTLGSDNCFPDIDISKCTNTVGSFECTCNAPYIGNGTSCTLGGTILDGFAVEILLQSSLLPSDFGDSVGLPSSLIPSDARRRKRATVTLSEQEARDNFLMMLDALHFLFTDAYETSIINGTRLSDTEYSFSFSPVFTDGRVPSTDTYLRQLTDTITSLGGVLPFPAPVLLSVSQPIKVQLKDVPIEISCDLLNCAATGTACEPATTTNTAFCDSPTRKHVSDTLVLNTDKTWNPLFSPLSNTEAGSVANKFKDGLAQLLSTQPNFDGVAITALTETLNGTVGVIYRATFTQPIADAVAVVVELSAAISENSDEIPYAGEVVRPLGVVTSLTATGVEQTVDCTSFVCENSGICYIDKATSVLPQCNCTATQHLGVRCETPDVCNPKPSVCHADADCVRPAPGGSATCQCKTGYHDTTGVASRGYFCQQDVTGPTEYKTIRIPLSLLYQSIWDSNDGQKATILKDLDTMFEALFISQAPALAGAIDMRDVLRTEPLSAIPTVTVEIRAYSQVSSTVVPVQLSQRLKETMESRTGNDLPLANSIPVQVLGSISVQDQTGGSFTQLDCSSVACNCKITAVVSYLPYCLSPDEATTSRESENVEDANVGVIIAGVLAGVVALIVIIALIFVCIPRLRADINRDRYSKHSKRGPAVPLALYSNVGSGRGRFSYYNQGSGGYDDPYANEQDFGTDPYRRV